MIAESLDLLEEHFLLQNFAEVSPKVLAFLNENGWLVSSGLLTCGHFITLWCLNHAQLDDARVEQDSILRVRQVFVG